jgi:flavin reductase (DIM6/NTAB) family NADH-FMN oxidoreductase RutF
MEPQYAGGCDLVDKISWDEAIELASPYPYVLAVTLDRKEKPNIIGLSWWTITSWNPRMIAISIGHPRYSHECIEHCGEFVLCFPSEEQARGAWLCGNTSGRNVDKFAETGFKQVPSKVVKPPIIDGSTVAFECRVANKVETGDHSLYIGEVVAIHGSPTRPRHLYSIHYRKLLSIDAKGNINLRLEYD